MNVRFGAVLLGAAFFCACGGNTPDMTVDAGACQVTYSGNFTGVASSATACGTLSTANDGGPDDGVTLTLGFKATTNDSVQLDVKINLGASASTGDVTSENVNSWSAVGLAAANNCLYSAGSAAVPPGNFTMTLSSVTGTPHGMLHIEQYVQAPPAVDCGAGDVETVDVTF